MTFIEPQVAPEQAAPPSGLTREELREVLTITLRAGQLMMENGAYAASAEETVRRLGLALGAERVDVYATPGVVIATQTSAGDHRTRLRRITASGIDLNRIAAVQDLSRRAEAGRLTRSQALAELDRISHSPPCYHPLVTMLAIALSCACFALLFGGGPRESLATFGAVALAQALRMLLERIGLGRLIGTWLVAAAAGGLGLGLALALAAPSPGLALVSAVLLLLPGVALSSAVSDLFRGDTHSGLVRGTSAALTLATIAAGIWAVLLLTGTPPNFAPGDPPAGWLPLALAVPATLGYAVLFDVPRRALPLCALAGLLGYGAWLFAARLGAAPEAALFLGGLVVGAVAEILARLARLPALIFVIPGFISLVPGVSAFLTVVSFAGEDYAGGVARLVETILLIAALAAGTGVVSALTRIGQRPPA